jgi:hypothetical protein
MPDVRLSGSVTNCCQLFALATSRLHRNKHICTFWMPVVSRTCQLNLYQSARYAHGIIPDLKAPIDWSLKVEDPAVTILQGWLKPHALVNIMAETIQTAFVSASDMPDASSWSSLAKHMLAPPSTRFVWLEGYLSSTYRN